jgi:hypothetical protein
MSPHPSSTARERAVEMLRVAAAYARQVADYAPSHVDLIHYDEADCDGCCVAADCEAAADELELSSTSKGAGTVGSDPDTAGAGEP